MSDRATNRDGGTRRIWYSVAAASLLLVPIATNPGFASPEDEVRATFERFVAAQNAHDVTAVASLLVVSPNFLWITRGAPVWGTEAALKRFGALYQGTWRLEPEAPSLKTTLLAEGAAQLYVPILFTIGPPGQSAQATRFLMNLVLVNTPAGWKVSSVLPIPAAAP